MNRQQSRFINKANFKPSKGQALAEYALPAVLVCASAIVLASILRIDQAIPQFFAKGSGSDLAGGRVVSQGFGMSAGGSSVGNGGAFGSGGGGGGSDTYSVGGVGGGADTGGDSGNGGDMGKLSANNAFRSVLGANPDMSNPLVQAIYNQAQQTDTTVAHLVDLQGNITDSVSTWDTQQTRAKALANDNKVISGNAGDILVIALSSPGLTNGIVNGMDGVFQALQASAKAADNAAQGAIMPNTTGAAFQYGAADLQTVINSVNFMMDGLKTSTETQAATMKATIGEFQSMLKGLGLSDGQIAQALFAMAAEKGITMEEMGTLMGASVAGASSVGVLSAESHGHFEGTNNEDLQGNEGQTIGGKGEMDAGMADPELTAAIANFESAFSANVNANQPPPTTSAGAPVVTPCIGAACPPEATGTGGPL